MKSEQETTDELLRLAGFDDESGANSNGAMVYDEKLKSLRPMEEKDDPEHTFQMVDRDFNFAAVSSHCPTIEWL